MKIEIFVDTKGMNLTEYQELYSQIRSVMIAVDKERDVLYRLAEKLTDRLHSYCSM